MENGGRRIESRGIGEIRCLYARAGWWGGRRQRKERCRDGEEGVVVRGEEQAEGSKVALIAWKVSLSEGRPKERGWRRMKRG